MHFCGVSNINFTIVFIYLRLGDQLNERFKCCLPRAYLCFVCGWLTTAFSERTGELVHETKLSNVIFEQTFKLRDHKIRRDSCRMRGWSTRNCGEDDDEIGKNGEKKYELSSRGICKVTTNPCDCACERSVYTQRPTLVAQWRAKHKNSILFLSFICSLLSFGIRQILAIEIISSLARRRRHIVRLLWFRSNRNGEIVRIDAPALMEYAYRVNGTTFDTLETRKQF